MYPLLADRVKEHMIERYGSPAQSFRRALLISGVARIHPIPEANAASNAATVAYDTIARNATGATIRAPTYTASAVAGAAAASRADNTGVAFSAANGAADAAFAAYAPGDVWAEIERDLAAVRSGATEALPLWSELPDWMVSPLTLMRTVWAPATPGGDFWMRWYQGFLDGRPLPWDLQRDIALIPDADWQKGEAHVAGLIAEIELRHAIAATPNAEIIARSPETGLLRIEPQSRLPGKHLADVIDTLRDAVSIFSDQGGPNGPYGAMEPECRIIEDATQRYAHRPVMLLRICRRVVERTILKEEGGDVPRNDPLVRDFVGSLAGVAGDLLAFDADVKEAEEARKSVESPLLTSDIAQALVKAAEDSAAISEGELKDELPTDARTATGFGSQSERAVALYVTRSRLLRIFKVLRDRGRPVVDHLEDYPLCYWSILAVLLVLLA